MKGTAQQASSSLYHRMVELFFSKLARASAWMFLGTVVGGILGYVFQVLMGRMLSTQEYALFSGMMALFAVLSTPLGTLMMVVSRKVSEYRARQDSGSITHFYYSVSIRTAVVGVCLLGGYLIFATQIQFYLRAPNIGSVYLLGVLLFLNAFPVISNAFLQGLQRFSWFSAMTAFWVLMKIACAGLLIWLGYGLMGAIGGIVLATVVLWAINYGALYRSLAQGKNKPYQTGHLLFKPALPVLVANVAFAAMTQLDMVLVNFYFPAHEAGLYAAASILGKAVMYLPGGIALALFPMVAENQARNQSSAYLLLQAVGLTTLLCGAGAVFYFLYGEWVIVFLYGESYRGAGEVLKFFGFAILPMALVMVAEHFLIAKGRVLFAYLFAFIAPLQLVAIHFYHESLQMVVAVMAASGVLLMTIGYGLLWRSSRQ